MSGCSADIAVNAADIARMGVGGLLAEADRPEPRSATRQRSVETVGALILAAGQSSRMGTNKLLEPLGGRPLFLHALEAAAAAGLPSIVVTGHQADRVAAALPAEMDKVHAAGHATGLSASLRAGIAAVPEGWDAAIVMLGDMPLVEPELLRALVAEARTKADIIVPERGGRRGNPILWGRDHFTALMDVEGDVGGKGVLAGPAGACAHRSGAL